MTTLLTPILAIKLFGGRISNQARMEWRFELMLDGGQFETSDNATLPEQSSRRAMGRSIVEVTDVPQYLELTRKVFANTPVYLLSGERSRPTWDVPPWALQDARAETVLPDVGHMMMMEQPELFVRTVSEFLS